MAPRLLTFGLVGRETCAQSALVIGVDPATEAATSSLRITLEAHFNGTGVRSADQ